MLHNDGRQLTLEKSHSHVNETVNLDGLATPEAVPEEWTQLEARIRRKTDLRLCSIAGILVGNRVIFLFYLYVLRMFI
jgi:hypothetical protein